MSELLVETALLLGVSLVLMLAFTRRAPARWPVYWFVGVAAVAGAVAATGRLLGAAPTSLIPDGVSIAVAIAVLGWLARHLQWPARLFLAALVLVSVVFMAILIRVTFTGSLPLLGLALSVVLLVLETCGILLSIAFTLEMAEALARDWSEPPKPESGAFQPRVCLQVPAYNEPPDLLIATLEALAALDYPNYMVQVVINNTDDPDLWQPVEATCEQLGERFQFINLPVCAGFKAGALNQATRLLPRGVELVGIVDADYIVQPNFLKACVPYFAEPEVAFVQTPQHYREWRDSSYLRGLFYAYSYFFDVTMVARSRANAIIFGGTMGLIRLSALRAVGGWAQWCVTEDAEASLRLLAQGWKSVYLHTAYGEGLMPLDFDGLRRQRFRWAFGGVQILRRHLGLLLRPGASKLTPAQRYHYLVGGVAWFGDAISVGLGAFLLLTAPFLAAGEPLLLRQLVGVVLILPVLLLVCGLLRLGWALKIATGAPWRDVPAAVLVMLALGWTVAIACARALTTAQIAFFRTPKLKTPSHLGRALRSTIVESTMATAFVLAAVATLARAARPLGLVVGILATWQALQWGSAPVASLLSQEVAVTPIRRLLRRSPQNTGERPWLWRARRLALAPVAAALLAVILIPALATSRADQKAVQREFGISPGQPIPALAAAPPLPTPRPSPTPSLGPTLTPTTSPGAKASGPSPRPSTAPAQTQPTPSPPPGQVLPSPRPTGVNLPHPTPTPHR